MSGRTLLAALEATARSRQSEDAITFLDARLSPTRYSFGDLFERSSEIALRIERRDLDPSAPLGLLLRSQEMQTLHYLAALMAGLVPAILTPPNRKLHRGYYAETTAAVIERCGFSAIVTDVEGLELDVPALAPVTIDGAGRYSGKLVPSRQNGASFPPDAAFLQFSSGTTGIKRGVVVSNSAALNQLETYGAAIGLGDADTIVSWLPLYHDMGFIACLNMPLARGVHCVMIDPIDWVTNPVSLLRMASDYRGTLSWNPNFAYAFMAQRVRDGELAGVDLSSLRGLVNCSEPVTHESQREFVDRFHRVRFEPTAFWGCYAMAETTFALTHGTASDVSYVDTEGPTDETTLRGACQVSVGRPLARVDLSVRDPDGRHLPDKRIGELWVRSPFDFEGYYNNPDATAEVRVDGWYRTGDLGYRVGDAFYIVGRSKDVLIIAGVNVFPEDIEALVSRVKNVAPGRASVFSVFDESAQTERVTILAELRSSSVQRETIIDIRQRVLAATQLAHLDVHAVPEGWLVKSSAGKMARGANKRKWLASTGRDDRGLVQTGSR